MPTHRTMMIRKDENEDELRLNMDLLTERREATTIREANYKTKMKQYYNQKVRLMSFKTDEYVYQRNEASRVEDQGKLGPKWKGPYRATEAYQNERKTFQMSPRANGQVAPIFGTQDVPDESMSQWPSDDHFPERKTFRMSPRANGQVTPIPETQDVPDESKSQWPSDDHFPERKTFRMSPRANGQVTPIPGMQDVPDESKSQWPSDDHLPERKTFRINPRANG
ncbi:hypothetical protein Tco_0870793 [Tanacetum coccineum]